MKNEPYFLKLIERYMNAVLRRNARKHFHLAKNLDKFDNFYFF